MWFVAESDRDTGDILNLFGPMSKEDAEYVCKFPSQTLYRSFGIITTPNNKLIRYQMVECIPIQP